MDDNLFRLTQGDAVVLSVDLTVNDTLPDMADISSIQFILRTPGAGSEVSKIWTADGSVDDGVKYDMLPDCASFAVPYTQSDTMALNSGAMSIAYRVKFDGADDIVTSGNTHVGILIPLDGQKIL